jgi:hypothetical protein
MYGQPGQQKSYRLGDHASGSGLPVGDYIVRMTAVEPGRSRDGKPQLKFASTVIHGPLTGKPQSWWHTLEDERLWTLSNDLIAAGFNRDFDPGPPDAERYAGIFAPGLVNRTFHIRISQNPKNPQYTNTNIIGPQDVDPAGNPVGMPPAAGPAQTAPPAAFAPPPAAGNGSYGNAPQAQAPMPYPPGYPPSAMPPQPPPPPAPSPGYPPNAPPPPGSPFMAPGTPTSPSGPAFGVPAMNVPQQPPQGSFAPPMAPGAPQPSPYAPPAGGTGVEAAQPPTAYSDATSLFRQQ